MNPLEAALRRLASDLSDLGLRWAVVGGLAVSARAEPRTTRDVDVVVAVTTDQEAEGVVRSLSRVGYLVRAVVEHEAMARLATARLNAPPGSGEGIVVDLLFASSGIETEIASGAEEIELTPDLRVPVARIGHLLALKVLARDDRQRPQDWDDMAALLGEANGADLEDARTALRLISERGFHRGKSLLGELERFIEEQGD
jgi:predicted nucleotidyltransferase